MDKDEVCKYIEVDSLEYLSVEDLVDAIGNDRNYALESFNWGLFRKSIMSELKNEYRKIFKNKFEKRFIRFSVNIWIYLSKY